MISTPLDQARFVVTDIETTGLSPDRHRITEVACVSLVAGDVIEEQKTLVNPGQHIPTHIQRMTGISNAMAFAAEPGSILFPRIRGWFSQADVLVAHNAPFDLSFLQASFRRCGLDPLDIPVLCTARLARRLLPARKGWSLGDLAAYLGVRIRNRHRALGDAQATALVLAELIERAVEERACETVADLIALQNRTIARFTRLPASILAMQQATQSLPSTPGVYRFLDRSGKILYVGKARNLRDRASSYFRAGAMHTKKITEMVRRARRVEFDETGSELAALLLESRLIKELQPSHNTLEKRFRRSAFLRLDLADDYPRLSMAQRIEADGAEYFGPFSSRRMVEMLVDTLGRMFRLRECDEPIVPDPAFVPCLYGQIGRCTAPCAGMDGEDTYGSEVIRLRRFLSGKEGGLLHLLHARMEEHAAAMEFEEAALLRNYAHQVSRLLAGRRSGALSVNDCNVVIVAPAERGDRRQLFMVRHGRLAATFAIGRRMPVRTIERMVTKTYSGLDQAPVPAGRMEIDEMRIISGYVARESNRGEFVWIEPGDSPTSIVEKILERISAPNGTGSLLPNA